MNVKEMQSSIKVDVTVAQMHLRELTKAISAIETTLTMVDTVVDPTPSKGAPVILLRLGDQGEIAKDVQRLLNVHNNAHILTVDGKYGPKSVALFKDFEEDTKQYVDGIVTDENYKILCAITKGKTITPVKTDSHYDGATFDKHTKPTNYHEAISFFHDTPSSTKDNAYLIKKYGLKPLSPESGIELYRNGLRRICAEANIPEASRSLFQRAVREGNVVNPPCATTNSQVLKHAFRIAGFVTEAKLFEDPNDFWPTHDIEYCVQRLGFSYWPYRDYVAPMGAVGLWTRYTFHGVDDHSGHVFMIFKDEGYGKSPLVGDNTRRSGEPHGHPYRAKGSCVGFWLPTGVLPAKRR